MVRITFQILVEHEPEVGLVHGHGDVNRMTRPERRLFGIRLELG